MKQLSAFVMLFFFATLSSVQAQDKKPPMSPRITAESPDKNIRVVYGQPSKRNRQVFGSLVPYGQVWRTGANEATEITFKNDVMFGGQMVKAGTYTMFTIPTEKEWTVILNSQLGQWGAYDYEKIKGSNVAQVKAAVSSGKTPIEKLTITPSNNSITIAWDNLTASVPVQPHGRTNVPGTGK